MSNQIHADNCRQLRRRHARFWSRNFQAPSVSGPSRPKVGVRTLASRSLEPPLDQLGRVPPRFVLRDAYSAPYPARSARVASHRRPRASSARQSRLGALLSSQPASARSTYVLGLPAAARAPRPPSAVRIDPLIEAVARWRDAIPDAPPRRFFYRMGVSARRARLVFERDPRAQRTSRGRGPPPGPQADL
jgi:hypothetical protein